MSGDPLRGLSLAEAQRVDALLEQAQDLDAEARTALLAQTRREAPTLAAALTELLAALSEAPTLEPPLPRVDATPEAAAGVPAGTRLGAWRILAPAGQGGMASVYRAERADGPFAQLAAIKLLDRAGSDWTARFAAEQTLLAQLEHPGIAQLLDGGVSPDGRPWFAMRWVEGQSLDQWLMQRRWSLPRRLALFEQIAAAVAHAHARLIVHRDLKPGNVRVDAGGHAVLLDFGIARLLDASGASEATRALLTPAWAAPEQLAGGPLTTAVDVHGLGLLLYLLLSGRHPWPEAIDSLAGAAAAIGQRDPPPLARAARADLPYPARTLAGDLDAIVQRALAKDPARRYVSVEALREDLARYRSRQPVLARRGALGYQLLRWTQRYWLPASLAVLAALSLICATLYSRHQAQIAAAERDVARLEAHRQEALREHLLLAFREGAALGSGATARQLLDASAARLDLLYAADPALRRAVLLSLGELYFVLGDYPAARAMLGRFLADPGDAVPNERVLAHSQLAQVLGRLGELDAAEAELATAVGLRGATPDPPRDLDVQLLTARSQLVRARGDLATGLELQREVVRMSAAAVDGSPLALGIARSNLGLALLQADQADAARIEFQAALLTWRHAGHERSGHAITTLGNLANVEQLLGRLAEADRHYREATTLAAALTAENAALAALLGNHARLALTRHQLDEAAALLARAQVLAARYSGADSVDVASLALTAADLALARGDRADAARATAQARRLFEARLGVTHPLLARVDLSEARIAVARQAPDALAKMERAIRRLGAGPPLLARQALRAELLLAEAALRAGDAERSRAALRRIGDSPAAEQLADWERAELRLWQKRIGLNVGPGPGADTDLTLLRNALGAGHPRVQALTPGA
ncbi:MAG: serine/threonine-protein kinase [Xanthomonadales bacterium]|jgi:non-specific serine/threonine protein kinase/serine/threonine-protein kinase|nr:serine/threonine-protein kinase [Xanthomonadales bacterium]